MSGKTKAELVQVNVDLKEALRMSNAEIHKQKEYKEAAEGRCEFLLSEINQLNESIQAVEKQQKLTIESRDTIEDRYQKLIVDFEALQAESLDQCLTIAIIRKILP